MRKEIITKFNKEYYLLGTRKEDNKKVWLEKGNFDCNWYWGLGYVEIFNNNYTDIEEYTHFDSLFFNGNKCCYDLFKEYFNEIVITDKEIWQLLEIMQTLYTMRKYSDMLYIKGSNITENETEIKDLLTNETEYKRINEVIIPTLLQKVYTMLGGVE